MYELFLGSVKKAGDKILGNLGGGGSTEVEQSLKSLNEIITSVMLKSVKQCSSSVTLDQKIRIVAKAGAIVNLGDIDFSQIAKLKANCNISSSQKTDILNEIEQKLKAHATSKTGPLSRFLNGDFEADVNIDVTNRVVNAIEQVDIAKCINNMALKQQFDIEAQDTGTIVIAGAIDMKQVADATSRCILDSDQFVNATFDLFSNMDTDIKSEQTGVDIPNPFEGLENITTLGLMIVGGVLGLIMLILIVVIIIVLIRRKRK